MDELNDSLEDYEVNEGIFIVISRNIIGMEDYNSGNEQFGNFVSLMQIGLFMVNEVVLNIRGEFDFIQIGIGEIQVRSSLGYRRFGLEGSFVFNISSGFLFQKIVDEEFVIFRFVGQLDFLVLDDIERNEDISRDRFVFIFQKNRFQVLYMVVEREEVYGF